MKALCVMFATVGIGLASPAMAATTYLKCSFINLEDEQQAVDIALNESQNSAEVYFPRTNGRSIRKAEFGTKSVMITMGMSGLPMFVTINRVNMKFTRASIHSGETHYEYGQCRRGTAPKRAF